MVKKDKKEGYQEIKERLSKDLYRNISMLGFIENNPVEEIYKEGETIVITGRSDHLWAYISSESKRELTSLINNYQIKADYYACLEDWMIPIIGEKRTVEWLLTTYRYILPENCECKPPQRKVRILTETEASYIFAQSDYKDFTSTKYIKERIKKGLTAGIDEGGRLIAWGLTHDDDALGFLHVLPEYRKQGYGTDITRSMIMKKRNVGKPVYLNVEPANIKSNNLVKQTGFIMDRRTSWVKLK